MKTRDSLGILSFAMIILFFVLPPHIVNSANLLDMADKLDKLDQQDFQSLLDKAKDCTNARDFTCSEKHLRKASKLANGKKDKEKLKLAKLNLQREQMRVLEEKLARLEEERRLRVAEERRLEERRLEEERREEESRLRAQREQEESYSSSNSSSPNYAQSFAQGVNSAFNLQNKLSKIQDKTMQDLNRIAQEKQARADEERRQRERATSERREQERQARVEADRRASERAAAERRTLENERIRQNQERQAQAERRAEELANERRLKQAQLIAKREDEEKRQALQKEEARKQEQAQKKAEDKAARLAEEKAKKLAEDQLLKSLAAGIRLVATKCPDGEGKYYATGTMPKIKSGCVDVHFRAYCPGGTQYSSGIANNFVGMAGCFGDTYVIDPKPPCKVEQVQIKVVKVVPGCN